MAYSKDLRIRAVEHFQQSNLSYREAALLFQIGAGTLFRWTKRYQQTGGIERLKSTGRPPLIPFEEFSELRSFVLENADSSLTEMTEKWKETHGQVLSISALSRTIARAGFTYKKNISCYRA
tara:strand:- start:810 stop:1175 length:366 start_codon:yes stop_codon:yes gene_type:complete